MDHCHRLIATLTTASQLPKLLLLLLMLLNGGLSAEFGDPGCSCRPQNPQHPQLAFCHSDFVLKVKIKYVRQVSNSTAHMYVARVKSVFKLQPKLGNLGTGSSIVLHVAGFGQSCGQVTVRQPNAPVISRSLLKGKDYLVTGHSADSGGRTEHQLQLSVCSWVAYWPSKRQRHSAANVLDGQEQVSRLQAHYLRRGLYASGCRTCQIEDGKSAYSLRSTSSSLICKLNPESDFKMCHARYSYCQYYSDEYTGARACAWHTSNIRAYRNCSDENRKQAAVWHGVNG